jgi:hypothetical protein
VTVGGVAIQPDPQIIWFAATATAAAFTAPFPVPANSAVLLRLKSPNAGDSDDVTCVARLYSMQDPALVGATFDTTTDSLEAIRNALVDSNPQNHTATADTQTEGTTTAGDTYADTETADAGYYQTQPEATPAGAYGLDVYLTFGIGVGRVPSTVEVTGRFTAGALRTVQIWAWSYTTGAFVQLSNSTNDFGHAPSADSTYQYALTHHMVKASDGEVKIRATSTSITTSDDFYWDYCNVTSVAQEAAGLTAAAIQQAVWARLASGHDEDTLGYNLSKTHILGGNVVSATDASTFVIDATVAATDCLNGMLIMLEDKTDDHYEVRRIISSTVTTNSITVDRAFGFTPVALDDYYVMSSGYADVNLTHVKGTEVTGTGTTADPWGP